MSPKKKKQLIILNSAIVLINIGIFSNALLGFELLKGTALTMSIAWMSVIGSVFAFIKGNTLIFKKEETHLLTQSIHSLNDCINVFQETINNGDVFDENIRISYSVKNTIKPQYMIYTNRLIIMMF